MQLRHLGVAVLISRTALLVEDLGKLRNRLSLPRRNLRRMQCVLGRKLRNRPVALNRLEVVPFLRQPVKVDSPMKRMIHHEDAQTVHGRVQGEGGA